MTTSDSPYEPNLFEYKVAASQRQTDPLQIDVQSAFCRLDVSVFIELEEALPKQLLHRSSIFQPYSQIRHNIVQHHVNAKMIGG
jgi:hypothetical protein